MNTSCAFCGTPPLDGKPCCTHEYRANVIRRADARIKRTDEELRTRQIQAKELELMLRAAIGPITFGRKETGWFVSCDAGRRGGYRNDHGKSLGWDWVIDVPDDGTGLPTMTDELRTALVGEVWGNKPSPYTAEELDRLHMGEFDRLHMAGVLMEGIHAAEQSIDEYDALGDNGPVMPGINSWTRAFYKRASDLIGYKRGGK